MTIPNPENAVIEIKKLRDYCLNMNHPRGKHKAKVFHSALGIKRDDAEFLQQKLSEAVTSDEAEKEFSDRFGDRYVIDFQLDTERGEATIRSSWIVRNDETFPRFVSCYVL